MSTFTICFSFLSFSYTCVIWSDNSQSLEAASFWAACPHTHPGLPERFQLFQLFEQNCRSLRLGIDIVVHVINVTWHNIQNSNLPTIRIIFAGLTSDACLETWTFPIYNTNRTNHLNCTIYCCLGSTLNSFDKRPDWQYCVFKVLKSLTVLIVKVQNEKLWPC